MLKWDNVKPVKSLHDRYLVLVDGEKIGEIDIARNRKYRSKDDIRKKIARELQVPVHYLKLRPKMYKT